MEFWFGTGRGWADIKGHMIRGESLIIGGMLFWG